jgi:ketosteroid isomerase-like protein
MENPMQRSNHTRAGLRLAAALCLLLFVAPATLSGQETQDTMKLAVPLRAARAALSSGYVALDPARVRPLFSDSAVVMFQDQTYRGRAAVDGWIAESLSGVTSVRFGPSSFTIGDAEIIDRGSYSVTLNDGSQVEGSSESVWRRQADGSWKVVRLLVM